MARAATNGAVTISHWKCPHLPKQRCAEEKLADIASIRARRATHILREKVPRLLPQPRGVPEPLATA
jgi:hypothetical protein